MGLALHSVTEIFDAVPVSRDDGRVLRRILHFVQINLAICLKYL